MKRKMPFSLYNALLCLLVAVIFVMSVLCLQTAEERWYLKADLSDDQISRLSDYTLSRLNALTENVSIYLVRSQRGSSLLDLQQETLLKIAAECERVRIVYVDPEAQPHMLASLAGDSAGIADGTVFVKNESETRTIRINPEEFVFARRIDGQEYTIYCAEAMLIGGIDRAVDENPNAVWFLEGHGEPDRDELGQVMLQCRAMGLEVHFGSPALLAPKAGDIVALIGPTNDFTDDETQLLKRFIVDGVHLMVAFGADTPVSRMNNVQALLDLYGLSYQSGWTVENPSQTAFFVGEVGMLVPALAENNGLFDTAPGRIILPRACALAEPALRPGTTAKVLLHTSDQAVLKADASAAVYTAEVGDVSGKMPLAILAESGDSYILQLASVQMLLTGEHADGAHVLDASENLAFLTACLEKMTDSGEGATLDAGVKQLPTQLITFESQMERRIVSAVLAGFWPGLLTLIMLIVVIRRRRL